MPMVSAASGVFVQPSRSKAGWPFFFMESGTCGTWSGKTVADQPSRISIFEKRPAADYFFSGFRAK